MALAVFMFFCVFLIVIIMAENVRHLFSAILNSIEYVTVRVACARTNRRSFASHPGRLALSPGKLRRLCPDLYPELRHIVRWIDSYTGKRAMHRFVVADQLIHADARAALVVSLDPLLVAAYSDDLDCIAMLRFPTELAAEYDLCLNQRLITVNRYWMGKALASDLEYGPLMQNRYSNFKPLIAEFLSDDTARLRRHHAEISDDEWDRTVHLAHRYLERFGRLARDGRPTHCLNPAPIATTPTP